jgi:hypothetical protein
MKQNPQKLIKNIQSTILIDYINLAKKKYLELVKKDFGNFKNRPRLGMSQGGLVTARKRIKSRPYQASIYFKPQQPFWDKYQRGIWFKNYGGKNQIAQRYDEQAINLAKADQNQASKTNDKIERQLTNSLIKQLQNF